MNQQSPPHEQRFLALFDWLPEISRFSLRADLVAAITCAVLVVPQGVAFAALTEAVSIGRSLALCSGQRLGGNREFIGILMTLLEVVCYPEACLTQ